MEGIVCFIMCFGTYQPAEKVLLDSYCKTYERIVRSRADLDAIKSLPKELRNRIQGNDIDYLCSCKGLRSKECQQSIQQ